MTIFGALADYFFPLRKKENLPKLRDEESVEVEKSDPRLERESKWEIEELRHQLTFASQPTWKLILIVVERLQREFSDFRMTEIVKGVQELDPNRAPNSIHPVVQGMTANAGKGPASPCGQPLRRVAHGIYTFRMDVPEVVWQSTEEPHTVADSRTSLSRAAIANEVDLRIQGVIEEFSICLDIFDQRIPFTRVGQYSLHRATIERRRSFKSVRDAIEDKD